MDVCSGISAPTIVWKPLGWQALCFAEIDPAPRAVLQSLSVSEDEVERATRAMYERGHNPGKWSDIAALSRPAAGPVKSAEETCGCFGDSGFQASTFMRITDGKRCCDLCGKPVETEPVNNGDLRETIYRAIADPGRTEGYKGIRSLVLWQTDAVMAALRDAAQPANERMVQALEDAEKVIAGVVAVGGDYIQKAVLANIRTALASLQPEKQEE